jgi:hypothetical protein
MEGAEALPRSIPPLMARWMPRAASLLLGVLLVVLFARSAQIASGIPPSFDGAMNLQVAASIAQGEGYRRNYAAREVFPHEIQTGPPYILPAAAVFKLCGIGIPQAEVVSLVYLALLIAVTCWIIAPLGGWPLALFGACTVLMLPGVHQYGLYGYGEIPALMWALAAMAVYFRGKHDAWSGLAAGLMLAFAVYTKTVLLIGAGALGLCALLEMLAAWRGADHGKWRRFVGFVAGGAVIVVAMEAWRALALGGMHAWHDWWLKEAGSIFMQAGVKPGFGKMTRSLLEKWQVHLGLLGHDYRLSAALMGCWVALVLVGTAVLIVSGWRRRRMHWLALAVALTAVVYLAWWLLVTPTAKAWHRRILDGMICADIAVIMVVAIWLRQREHTARMGFNPVWVLAPAVVVLLLPATWLAKGTHTLLMAPPSQKTCSWFMADAASCGQLDSDAGVSALLRVVREVRALPSDAYVFGLAWYSAPRVGLLAQRHLLDFHDVPVATMHDDRPIYFVQGPDTPPAALERIRTLYDVTRTPDYAYALIRVRSLTPAPMVVGNAPVRRHIEAAEHYPYLRGFNRSEGANGRWLTDDNQVLLVPRPGDVFELTVYAVPVDQYEVHRAPNVIVSFDGCRAGEQAAAPGQLSHLLFPIPVRCGIGAGQPVNIRIEVDNLVESGITHDARALGVVAKSFGFVSPDAPRRVSGKVPVSESNP